MALSEGEKHLCEWSFGMANHFFTALFAAMKWADELNLNRLSLGYADEVNAFRRYKKETGFWPRIEAEWRASFQQLYRPGKPKEPPMHPGAGPEPDVAELDSEGNKR